MADKTIRYNLEIDNNTKSTYNEVQKDSKKTETAFGNAMQNMSNASAKFGQEFGTIFKREAVSNVKSLGKTMSQAFLFPLKLLADVSKSILKLAFNAAKTAIVMAVLEKAFVGIANANKNAQKSGNSFIERITGGLIKISPLASLYGSAVKNISVGHNQLRKTSGVYDDVFVKVGKISEALSAFGIGFRSVGINKELTKVSGSLDTLIMKRAQMAAKGKAPSFVSDMELKRLSKLEGQLSKTQAKAVLFESSLKKIPKPLRNIATNFFNVGKSMGGTFKGLNAVGSFFINMASKIVTNWQFVGVMFAGVAAAIITLKITWKSLMATINETDAIDKFSRRIGFAAERYVAWDFILKRSGSTIKEMETVIGGLAKSAFDASQGGGLAARGFELLDVSVKTASGGLRDNEKLFTEVISKLSKMEDKATRNGIALSIFGARGRALIPVLDEFDGGLENVIGEFDKYSEQIQRATAAGAEFKDNQEDIATGFKVAKMVAFTKTTEALADTLNIFKQSNFGAILRAVGVGLLVILNRVIHLFNVMFGLLSQIVGSFAQAFNLVVAVVLRGVLKIVKTLDKFKLTKKLVSGIDIAAAESALNSLDKTIEKSQKKQLALGKQIRESALQFIGFDVGAPTAKGAASGGTPDLTPKTKTTTAKPGTPGKGFAAQLAALEAFNRERLAILDRFADLAISNIKNQKERELAILVVNIEKQQNIITRNETFGLQTAEEVAANRLALIESAAKKREAIEVAAAERAEAAARAHMDNIRSMFQSATSQIADAWAILKQGATESFSAWQNMIDLVDQFNSELAATQQQSLLVAEGFFGVQDAFMSSMDVMTEAAVVFSDVNATEMEKVQASMRTVAEVGSAVASTLFNTIQASSKAAFDSTIKDMDKWFAIEKKRLDGSRISNRRRTLEIAKLEEDLARKKDAARKEEAQKQQKIAIIQSIIGTALAVTSALSMAPPPLGIAMAIIVGALGAAQIGVIASQSFAKGGIVGGSQFSGDNVKANVNSGEMILNQRQQKTLFDIANDRAGQGSNITITMGETIIQGNADAEVLDEKNLEQRQFLLDTLDQLGRDGQIQQIVT